MQYKLIKFGPEGYPLFYYCEVTYPPILNDAGEAIAINADIPLGAIRVTEEQWLAAQNTKLWLAPDGSLTAPPPAPEIEINLTKYAADKRWYKEVGGIEVNGLTVSTDDRSKTMISGARVAAQNDPTFSTQWKSSDGTFATINAAGVIAISDAMLTHVSDCFAIEAQVLAEIDAGTISSFEQIDAAFA